MENQLQSFPSTLNDPDHFGRPFPDDGDKIHARQRIDQDRNNNRRAYDRAKPEGDAAQKLKPEKSPGAVVGAQEPMAVQRLNLLPQSPDLLLQKYRFLQILVQNTPTTSYITGSNLVQSVAISRFRFRISSERSIA